MHRITAPLTPAASTLVQPIEVHASAAATGFPLTSIRVPMGRGESPGWSPDLKMIL